MNIFSSKKSEPVKKITYYFDEKDFLTFEYTDMEKFNRIIKFFKENGFAAEETLTYC